MTLFSIPLETLPTEHDCDAEMSVMTDIRGSMYDQGWSQRAEAPVRHKPAARRWSEVAAGTAPRAGTSPDSRSIYSDAHTGTAMTVRGRGLTASAVDKQFGLTSRPQEVFATGQLIAVLYYNDEDPEENGMIITREDLRRVGKPVTGKNKAHVIPMVVVEAFDGFAICCAVRVGLENDIDMGTDVARGQNASDSRMGSAFSFTPKPDMMDIECVASERSIRLFDLVPEATKDRGFHGKASHSRAKVHHKADIAASFVVSWDALIMDMGLVADASMRRLLAHRN